MISDPCSCLSASCLSSTVYTYDTNLTIPHQNNLSTWATLRKVAHSRDNRSSALRDTLTIADATARRAATTSRIHDGFGGGALVISEDAVDDALGRAVTWWSGGFAGGEDVDGWA